jgi:hypothetical protein
MWIVRIALRRPYTFVVLALLILMVGPLTIARTPTDIFPNINIPVVTIVWNYGGLSADEMSTRIVYNVERSLTTTVNDIEHIESQSLSGVGLIKVFFQPSAKIEMAVAQVTAIMQTQLRQLPPGATPPLVIVYNASSVPVLQLALSGKSLSEQQLYDFGFNFIRTQLATVQGAANFEKSTLEAVTKARASVGQAAPPNAGSIPNDPAAFARFQAAQDQLSGALSRLLVVAEAYPDLKATQNFRDLQAQLEGTENRISVERMRYNEAARDYNTARQRFPTGLFAGLLGFHEKNYFKAQPDAATAPKVEFGFSPAPALPAGSPAALPPAPSARP